MRWRRCREGRASDLRGRGTETQTERNGGEVALRALADAHRNQHDADAHDITRMVLYTDAADAVACESSEFDRVNTSSVIYHSRLPCCLLSQRDV